MRASWALILFGFTACLPGSERAQQKTAPATDDGKDEPPPHYHDNSRIPPDDLTRSEPVQSQAAEDAGAQPGDCPMSEPPALEAKPERIRSGPPVTNYIPHEIIMRPIRERAACFRGCYQAGLARNPKLAGRIAVRFVIDADGWVRKARVVETELADQDSVDCVRRAFVGLQYPAPNGGPVTIVYPLVFAP